MLALVTLTDDLRRAAEAAVRYAEPGEELTGIIPAEPAAGERVYLCAYALDGEERTWLVVDDAGRAVDNRLVVRDTVSIAALCELAEETAGGGDLDELASELVALRLTEAPEGIEEAENAVRGLQMVIGSGARVASLDRLDEVGEATRRLEVALGGGGSPFAEAMKAAIDSAEALQQDVERNYKRELN
jgi:hypothetical protein